VNWIVVVGKSLLQALTGGYRPELHYAPVWVAERNGFFKDEGVEARFEIFDNAEKINEAMHSGRLQIAIASVEALVADAFKDGKFRIIASVAQKPPHFIIAQPGIKTLNDLRGKRFGVLSLHEGTTYFVQDLEKHLGFKRGDIIIDAVGGAPTRWKLLREGKIDAGLQPFPLSYESEAAGFSNLGPISTVVRDYEFTAVFLDPAWAAGNRPIVTGFLRALQRGQQAMIAKPDRRRPCW
jgi:NitT/TauT family transport system substrate-binding protein